MNTLDERLANRLHDIVDGEPGSVPPVGALLERGRRARRRRTTALAGATCALLALGVATAATVATTPAPRRPGVTAQASPPASPAIRLVSAAAASENISYRMRLTNSGPQGLTYEGAFDPRTATGYVHVAQDDSVMTELLINGTRYEGGERPRGKVPADKTGPGETYGRYGQYPGRYDRLSLYGDGNTVLGAASPDPAALFTALKSANATISENPDGTLHFEYATSDKVGSTTTAGDVTLDGDGRIATVALTGTWQSTAKGRLDTGTFSSTLELFDYGVTVTVKRPADVVKVKQ
ncbi:hypothetical protein GCE86_28025 [Micromonospora terminaliae]|uniref:Uncharacterized protein n=1 Tax=Micromonospora terminaliae TaxID=1914461 RepID=A0AAJ2ZBL0_9ACTN|nr:hypothetical protein [Micromonospora terminaliae]NES26351.1 hypothetical protein [Micromonospora terminaliae]QGL50531.1 hypothetical protein GCE86_28025 [Micromonospora terminaliae]